ncbi:MAG: hypothetical protein AAF962_24780 [Actinomycetota bacterium]
MNAGGHIAVAHRLGTFDGDDDSGVNLGAALPDLASIGHFRLRGSTDDDAVSHGIDLHHRTDDAFHQHPWFTGRNRELADRLGADGVGRGPARACSHVGIELLLDGELLRDPTHQAASADAYNGILDRLDDLESLVEAEHRARWRLHLTRVAERHLPDYYDDPQAVAALLHRILSARPRLALPTEHVPVVAAALADVQPDIAATATDLLGQLRAEVA